MNIRSKRSRIATTTILGCRRCLRILTDDQRLVPGSRWGKLVVRRTRQLRRIEERLASPGLSCQVYRCLHERKALLLELLAHVLKHRYEDRLDSTMQLLELLHLEAQTRSAWVLLGRDT